MINVSTLYNDRETIKRLKHYVNQISISDPNIKYEIIDKIEKGKLNNSTDINDEIKKLERGLVEEKNEDFIFRVNSTSLNNFSKNKLIDEIKDNKFKDLNQLSSKIYSEYQKRELYSYVDNLDNYMKNINMNFDFKIIRHDIYQGDLKTEGKIKYEYPILEKIENQQITELLYLINTKRLSYEEENFLKIQIEEKLIKDEETLMNILNNENKLRNMMKEKEKDEMIQYVLENYNFIKNKMDFICRRIRNNCYDDLNDLKRRINDDSSSLLYKMNIDYPASPSFLAGLYDAYLDMRLEQEIEYQMYGEGIFVSYISDIRCPKCGEYYGEGNKYCPYCGTKKYTKKCPKCQYESDDNICPRCGEDLVRKNSWKL